jgi:hypothetical protein
VRGDEVGTGQTGPLAPGTGQGPAAPRPSWIGVGIGVAMFLLGMLGCLATGLAAGSASEDDAVVVSYIGIPLALAGVVAPIAALLVRERVLPVSIGVPVGCGCATAVASTVGLVVFFTLVWPSL